MNQSSLALFLINRSHQAPWATAKMTLLFLTIQSYFKFNYFRFIVQFSCHPIKDEIIAIFRLKVMKLGSIEIQDYLGDDENVRLFSYLRGAGGGLADLPRRPIFIISWIYLSNSTKKTNVWLEFSSVKIYFFLRSRFLMILDCSRNDVCQIKKESSIKQSFILVSK